MPIWTLLPMPATATGPRGEETARLLLAGIPICVRMHMGEGMKRSCLYLCLYLRWTLMRSFMGRAVLAELQQQLLHRLERTRRQGFRLLPLLATLRAPGLPAIA